MLVGKSTHDGCGRRVSGAVRDGGGKEDADTGSTGTGTGMTATTPGPNARSAHAATGTCVEDVPPA